MNPEIEAILNALREARRTLLITVLDVADPQVAEPSTVSELTLGGILNHLTQGERAWTHTGVARRGEHHGAARLAASRPPVQLGERRSGRS
ncbi:DUF664 domain-containing protein [Streptomyces sp. M10(2022)]